MQVSAKSPAFDGSRGLRFLDLVRQNKLNVSPQLSKKRRISMDVLFKEKIPELQQNKTEEKKYLQFSCTQHDPNASPSSSILSKRKLEVDSSPHHSSAKRKRVGFSDPVSSTKEYLITEEEEKLKSNSLIRCLTYENDAGGVDDDEEEICSVQNQIKIEIVHDEVEAVKVESEVQDLTPMLDHDYNEQHTDITTSSDESMSCENKKLTFKDKNELMLYITKNLSVDELFDQLTQAEEESLKRKELITKVVKTIGFNDLLKEFLSNTVTIETPKLSKEQKSRVLAILNEISKLMTSNNQVKHKVLDFLSEKHSKEFLEHALQENSTSTVCDKITMPNVINYLIHKVNIAETTEYDEITMKMNRSALHHLINSTDSGAKLIKDHKELQDLMLVLFKNMPKIEIFDVVHEFLRKLVPNH